MRAINRLFPLLALSTLLALLAACSGDKQADQIVLAHVPADTPWVFANLEPIKPEVLDAWLVPSNAQIPMQVRQYRDAASELQEDAPQMAKLMSAMADEMDGKTVQQVFAGAGVDLGGRFAWYGVGLSPVMRGQLKDPAKFQAFVDRMAKAADVSLTKARVGDIDYQHFDVPKTKLQVVVAHHEGQFVLALLPLTESSTQLGLALGSDMPQSQGAVAARLEKVASSQGYQPQGLGYLDTGKLLADVSSGQDALLKALLGAAASGDKNKDMQAEFGEFSGADCQADLERIAARVPQISFGLTHFDTQRADQRMNVSLAPDISAAFDRVKSSLPGLGSASGSPVECALALPLPQIRDFWTSQAQAVASKPFTCKPLIDLNKGFEQIGQQIGKTAIPPFGNLRGVHVAIDKISMGSGSETIPRVQARVVLALKDPESVVAMAKSMLQPLNNLQLKTDGKPVELPPSLSQFSKDPIWLAMNDHALVVGIGAEEKDKLEAALSAKAGSAGQLMSMNLEGATVAQWIRAAGNKILADTKLPDVTDSGKNANAAKGVSQVRDSIEAAAKSYENLKHLGFKVHMDKAGLVIESETQLK